MSEQQLRTFIKLLSGDELSQEYWQVFHDSDKSDTGKDLAKNFYDTVERSCPFLNQRQQQGCGVYLTINESDGRGRHANNIQSLRACFIDGDDQPLPTRWAIEPDMIVMRSDRYWHAYWLLKSSVHFQTWMEVQYQIALYYGVKDRLFDLSRVMRAPGFNHLKDPNNPQEYKLTYHTDGSRRYAMSELIAGHNLNPQQMQEYQSWLTAPKIKRNSDAVAVINDSQAQIDNFVKRLSKITPEEGDLNNTLYRCANIGKDLGLLEQTTVKYIQQWWVSSWSIPVEPKAIQSITANAYRYGSSAIGSETTAGKFANAPPVTEQVGSGKDLRTVVEGMETADVKYGKNHTINARVFLQACNDAGIYYVTVKQEPYVFTDTHYRRLEPKELDKHVLEAMLKSRPGSDTVSGTCKIVSLLTTNNYIEKSPSWITPSVEPRPLPRNLIAFKNGILDISNNQWIEHTHDLFYNHCLEYDYDPSAQCPKWLQYLNFEVLDYDQQQINLLQEWIGYMLVNNYDFQKIMVFLGAPRSGKGTIAGVIRHIVGKQNVVAPTLSKLLNDPTLDVMQDKAVAIIGDAHKVAYNKRDEVLEILKMLSGCDPITFSRKYIGSATVKFPTRFTLCANKMPEFLDSSGAMVGRLLIITFRNSYLGKEDPKRLERLLEEAPGIMNWALEGYRRLKRNGKFTQPDASAEILTTLDEEFSPVKAFLKDCVKVTANRTDIITESEMFNVYKTWCAVHEFKSLSSQVFKRDFASCDYKIHRTRDTSQHNRPRIFSNVIVTQNFENVTPMEAVEMEQENS